MASLLGRNRELDVKRDSASGRERELLRLMADGLSSPAIAERMGISYATVRTHLRSLDAKLGAHSKLEVVVTARQMKIIE